MRAKLHDFSDLEEMFGGAKQDDWRDGAATGADTAGHKTAPETAVKKRSGSIDTGNGEGTHDGDGGGGKVSFCELQTAV